MSAESGKSLRRQQVLECEREWDSLNEKSRENGEGRKCLQVQVRKMGLVVEKAAKGAAAWRVNEDGRFKAGDW